MKQFVAPSLDGHAADVETLHFLYGLVGYLKPTLIVEAGTYRGHASCIMGTALRDFKLDGEIWTADVEPYDAAQTVANNGLEDIVHLFTGDFGAMLEGPLKERKARLAFIDSGLVVVEGAPNDAGVRSRHAALTMDRLAVGGIMVVDDMNGQWVNVEALRENADILLTTCRGMAIVQRR